MGRNRKQGLEFFPFDVDFFSDIKVRKLIKYQGGKAVTVYLSLLCMIYKEGYYIKWDKELPFIVSENTGYDEAYIQEVIECCMRLGLVDDILFKSEGVITSRGIQERYRQICSRERRLSTIDEYSLADSNDGHLPAQPKEYFAALCEPSPWRVTLAGRNNLTEQELLLYIAQFDEFCRNRGKVHQDLDDARQHFANWLCKKLEKQVKTKKNGQQSTATRPNKAGADPRRRGVDKATAPADSYTGDF